ncbi:MAG: NAD(P) transhydrogenase subunit alpha [Pseudomonadota bacterium]
MSDLKGQIDALKSEVDSLSQRLGELSDQAQGLAASSGGVEAVSAAAAESGGSATIFGLTVLVLAVFVGYHVVWRVTPALHSPLMGVTNAISSVIIVGGLIAAGTEGATFSEIMGFIAVTLAAVNIFGGFIVTYRMLAMFKKKPKPAAKA